MADIPNAHKYRAFNGFNKPTSDAVILWGVRESELNRITKSTSRHILVNAAHCVANHPAADLSQQLGALASAIVAGSSADIKEALAPFVEAMNWAVTLD